eukprot:4183248-Amphidinium_carterae.1
MDVWSAKIVGTTLAVTAVCVCVVKAAPGCRPFHASRMAAATTLQPKAKKEVLCGAKRQG